MHIQRVVSQNASDFHLEGPEKENFINIPSSNFHHNGLYYNQLYGRCITYQVTVLTESVDYGYEK